MVNEPTRQCDAACESRDDEAPEAAACETAAEDETAPDLLQVIRRVLLEGDD